MRFSKRTGWESGENEWASAVRRIRDSGGELLDLTVSNPTLCGLGPTDREVLQPLSDPRALHYMPAPLGMSGAREAVSVYYAEKGAVVDPQHVCLTTSTSEAYSFLFRLLCDPGDEVLVATPSYPLFDLLAQLDDVVLRPYPLFYDPGAEDREGVRESTLDHSPWQVDLHTLAASIGERTRAILVVHPNNPTGSFVSPAERVALRALCAAKGIALIADEVFLDYGLGEGRALADFSGSFVAEARDCLCFTLSGLSKVCALPQMKLSWIAVTGPEALVAQSMERLEIIADTFLSVSAPTQFALPEWLQSRGPVQARIRTRCMENLRYLDDRIQGGQCSRLQMQGGWTVILRVPRNVAEEEFAFAAMRRGVLVQPGEFYGLSRGHCVLSLLTSPDIWKRALERLPWTE